MKQMNYIGHNTFSIFLQKQLEINIYQWILLVCVLCNDGNKLSMLCSDDHLNGGARQAPPVDVHNT